MTYFHCVVLLFFFSQISTKQTWSGSQGQGRNHKQRFYKGRWRRLIEDNLIWQFFLVLLSSKTHFYIIKINEFILSGNTFRSKQCKHLNSLFKKTCFCFATPPSSLSEITGNRLGLSFAFTLEMAWGWGENEVDDAFTTGKTKKLHIIIQPCE